MPGVHSYLFYVLLFNPFISIGKINNNSYYYDENFNKKINSAPPDCN